MLGQVINAVKGTLGQPPFEDVRSLWVIENPLLRHRGLTMSVWVQRDVGPSSSIGPLTTHLRNPMALEVYRRLMRAVAVPDSHEFGQNGMWDTVRDQVCGLLVTQQFLH